MERVSRADFQKQKIKDDETEIGFEFSSSRTLSSRGFPKQIFSVPAFSLEQSTVSFTSEVEGLKPKSITKLQQVEWVKKIIDNPFHAPYTFCVSGKPNDMKAKLLAGYIMHMAVDMQLRKNDIADDKLRAKVKKYLADKSLPLFYNVNAGFNNPLIEKSDKPSLIVLANVPQGSTPHKLEKLRDIMEHFAGIPKIVVTAGHDPLTFFNTSLFLHLNYCCLLVNSAVKKTYEV